MTRASTPAGGRRVFAALTALFFLAVLVSFVATPGALAERTAPRIIGGVTAPADSWPSQAALLDSLRVNPGLAQFCGGTLIDPNWVLTAAHCVTTDSGAYLTPADVQVAVGIQTLSSITPSDRIGVAEVVVHPEWRTAGLRWDAALLRLATPSSQPTMQMIQPSELSASAGGRPAEMAGWGCTATEDESCVIGGFPDSLQELRTNFVSDSECASLLNSKALGIENFDPDAMICAGSVTVGDRRACVGDSGGPVTASVGGRRVLAGLTSFGSARPLCTLPNFPSVFTRVASVRGWADAKLGRRANLSAVSLKPAKKKVKAGKKVSLRVTVTNVGNAATTATVKLSVNNRKKAKVPGSVRIPVDAAGTATGAVTVTTKRGKGGKVTVKAILGSRVAKSAITLSR